MNLLSKLRLSKKIPFVPCRKKERKPQYAVFLYFICLKSTHETFTFLFLQKGTKLPLNSDVIKSRIRIIPDSTHLLDNILSTSPCRVQLYI